MPALGGEPDARIQRLRTRLARISRTALRRTRWRDWPHILRLVVLAFCVVTVSAVPFVRSPWSANITARHLAAARNCDAARAVDLAPARRGQPGYWPWLDRDNDGIACEPWHGRN